MSILEGDIKLLKSAVMADTPDGGGAMTGAVVVDGQSNNLFPDTSTMDRAIGRVAVRKVFGVAHSDDTDTLLGAHGIVVSAPADPLVHCTLMQTPGWADTRTTAREIIERYVVKGSRISPRLMDTHFAGSLQLRLISGSANTDFPRGGDAIALRAPDGHEQYVRVTRVAFTTQTFFLAEGGGTVEFVGTICTCELGQRLDYDYPGPPVSRTPPPVDAAYTRIYNTTRASGAQFYGIKPLAANAAINDISVIASGIFTPLVPAATIETPIVDQFPLQGRPALLNTGRSSVTLAGTSMRLLPGAVVTAPTPMQPGSVALAHGASVFTDDSLGNLKLGTLVVGAVDYIAGTATFGASSPDYGTNTATLTFTPATVVGASSFSSKLDITLANQGLAFVTVLEPPPAPGSLTFSYMVQGRWYDLIDDKNGKLAGADTGYGVGSINYGSGSMSLSLGALPDVGSPLIANWGDISSATPVDPTLLATKAGMAIALPVGASADGVAMAWARGGVNYTATSNAAGVVSGAATGQIANGVLMFEPNVFPDGNVSVTTQQSVVATGVTSLGGGSYQLAATAPIAPGSFAAKVIATYPASAQYPENPLTLFDAGGIVYLRYSGNAESSWANRAGVACGTIDYATGVVQINATASIALWVLTSTVPSGTWSVENYRNLSLVYTTVNLGSPITSVSAASGTVTPNVQSVAPGPWLASIATSGPPLIVSGMVFTVGGERYYTKAGAISKGWNPATGMPTAAAGTVSSDGVVSVTLPPTSGLNNVAWANAAQDTAARSITGGVFRTASAPLKTGVFQLKFAVRVGSADDGGIITGGGFTGNVDFERGVTAWHSTDPVDPASLSYNAVFLQYLPINGALLGLETARLPLDGKVPIFRSGDLQLVHNTQTYTLPNPLVKGTVYNVGRVRVAAVKVKTAAGATVDPALYTTNLDAGEVSFLAGADLAGMAQPFKVEHRIEDMLTCSAADISGKLTFTSRLTHAYPKDTSFVSSVLAIGDVFARTHNYFEQATWTGVWSDTRIGDAPLANFNEASYPPVTTNRGAITERWLMLFTNTTAFDIVGENVGVIGSGTTALECAPINPATGVPYFVIPALGWGSKWATGNAYRFNTSACGAPLWVVRTVLQGPATFEDDRFTLAWRGDVDRPPATP